jgi:hypothetical protein
LAHVIDRDPDEPTSDDDASADVASADDVVAPPARGRRTGYRPVVEAALLAAAGTAAATFVCSHWALQHAGAHNAGVSFLLPWPDVVAGAVWAATVALLVRAAWAGAGVPRHLAAGGLIGCAAATAAAALTAAPRVDRYQAGLQTWAAEKLDFEAVRAWNAASGGGDIPPADWPPAIVAVEPAGVEKVAGGQGVILRWGAPGGVGYARRVFVAGMPRGAPFDDGKGGWRAAAEGVYVGLQQAE